MHKFTNGFLSTYQKFCANNWIDSTLYAKGIKMFSICGLPCKAIKKFPWKWNAWKIKYFSWIQFDDRYIHYPYCGNYCTLLPQYFRKNSVKSTFLLKNWRKIKMCCSGFHDIPLSTLSIHFKKFSWNRQRMNICYFSFTEKRHWHHSEVILRIHSHTFLAKISWNQRIY